MNKSDVSTIRREGNSASLIYERLRTDILNGTLAPGTPLSQLAIAKANGTSRGPVREALRRLQQDQLVLAYANRRFDVAPFDMADLENVLSLHLANITLAIRVSVPFLTDNDLALLDQHIIAMEAAIDGDKEQWEFAYRNFVLVIARHAGDRTVSLAGSLIDNIQRYRANLLDRFPRVYAGGPEFRRVIAAAKARDGLLAALEYASFFGRVSSLIIAGASPRYDAARLRGYIEALGSHSVDGERTPMRGAIRHAPIPAPSSP